MADDSAASPSEQPSQGNVDEPADGVLPQGMSQHPNAERVDEATDRASFPLTDGSDPAAASTLSEVPSGFGLPVALRPSHAGQRFAPQSERKLFRRRRRRYMLYVHRSARARQTARRDTWARVAWGAMALMLTVVVLATTVTVSAATAYYESRQADIIALRTTVSAKDSIRVYDVHGTLLYEFADVGSQHSVPLPKVPLAVVNATIAIEDHSFWSNQGVDFQSMVRAAYFNLTRQTITQGGSTITQQLIKQNVLNSNETFDRKLKEAILAFGMTSQGVYTKTQILEMYLNSIPYGEEAYGIDAAAHTYFGYSDDAAAGVTAAEHLNLAQASMLAGIPQNPNLNNPLLHPIHARARQAAVLAAMVQSGYITQAQAQDALEESAKPDFFHPTPPVTNLAPHFVYYIRGLLENMVETGQLSKLSRTGLNVYTTLDLDLQNHVQDYMKQHLYGSDRDDYVGHHFISQDHLTNTAAILADHHNGDIKVMLGSVDFYNTAIDGQVNVVTQSFRGPGSSFKPIVYATAFQKGWFPAMVVSDSPTVFWDSGAETTYKPLNFHADQFLGNITLRQALQFSLNIPAVKVMQYAGVDEVEQNARRMGITKWYGQWGLSSVLGSLDVSLYELTQAYTVFANQGQFIPLHAINSITDGTGNVLFQYQMPAPVQVLSPQIAFLITSILSDNPSRAGDFGTCSPLYLDPDLADCYANKGNSPNAWPAAAKTGTGQDFRDDWTMGYTMDYTMGVWAGNNDHSPMIRIDGITGAAPTWYRSMLYAERNQPKRPFPVPPGVQQAQFSSGGVTTTDWFLSGALPHNDIGNSNGSTPCVTLTNDANNPWTFCPSSGQPPPGPTVSPAHSASP